MLAHGCARARGLRTRVTGLRNLSFRDGKNGGHRFAKNELTEPTACLIYEERWTKRKVDISELVTLRESGLKWQEITARLGVSRTTLHRATNRKLKARKD